MSVRVEQSASWSGALVVARRGTGRAWIDRSLLPLVGLLAVVGALGLLSLLRTPPPFVDEAWYAARAAAFLQTGWAFGPLDSGVLDAYEEHWTFFPWLGTAVQAAAVHLFGLSLHSMRLVSLLFGLALLVAVYAIGNHLGGRRLGLLAVALVAVSRPFLYSSHLARQDVMVAALGFGAIALVMTDRSRRLSIPTVAAGLAVGLACEIHPNGAIYGPATVALLVAERGWPVVRTRRFWGLAAGALAGLAFYAALHILPYPATFVALNRLLFVSTHTPPFLAHDPAVWLESLAATGRMLLADLRTPLVGAYLLLLCTRRTLSERAICLALATLTLPFLAGAHLALRNELYALVPLLLLAGAGVALVQKPARGDRAMVVAYTALLLATIAFMRNRHGYYAILTSPATDLLLASLLTKLAAQRWSSRGLAIARAALVATLVVGASLPLWLTMRHAPMDDYQATVERIRAAAPG